MLTKRSAMRVTPNAVSALFVSAIVLSIVCLRFAPPPGPSLLATVYFVIVQLGAASLMIAPGIVVMNAMPSAFQSPSAAPAVVLIAGAMIGWLQFLAWFMHPVFGAMTSIVVVVTTVARLVSGHRTLRAADMNVPLLIYLLICLLYFCLAGERGDYSVGSIGMAFRFWTTPDNILPKMFADALMAGADQLRTTRLADWHLGDRPPLETGMMMPLYWTAKPAAREISYIALGTAVNGTWVLALWAFLRRLQLSELRILLTVLAVAACGAVYFNTVYAWPKMVGGALILCSAVILIPKPFGAGAAAIAGLAASLSLLAHGASAFGIVGMAHLFWGRFDRQWFLSLSSFGSVAAITYLPWMAYQKFFDPPGDRLIKWHLAGVPKGDDRGALQTIIEQYRLAGLTEVLQNKINNVAAMIGATVLRQNAGWKFSDPLSVSRTLQSSSVILAAGILIFGVLALLFNRRLRQEPWIKPTFAILLTTAASSVVLEFGNAQLAMAYLLVCPFSLLLLWCAAGAIAISGFPPTARNVIFGLHFLSFALVWVFLFPARSATGETASYAPEFGLSFVAAVCVFVLAVLVYRTATADCPRSIQPEDTSSTWPPASMSHNLASHLKTSPNE